MTTISAKTILRSRHAQRPDKILSSLFCRYPRWIHAEGRTHRQLVITEDLAIDVKTPSPMESYDLSRNAASSRAIPILRMVEDVMTDPAIPLFWGKHQKGMQAVEEFVGAERQELIDQWLRDRDDAVKKALWYHERGLHKQIPNRILEPYSHINVLFSGTEWTNFRALREHNDAEPHIHILAREIGRELDREDNIQTLEPGQWHTPFVGPIHGIMTQRLTERDFIKKSVACCASTSYKTVDGFDMTIGKAIELHDKLVGSAPLHASPAEHVAQADKIISVPSRAPLRSMEQVWSHPEQHGNFVGFRQYRKQLPNECL
ncbi:hypothetical protein [Mesorhizobium sp. CN2-181]|uniref:hypothetical protein n=1 Tax=Mesorhizobium yinganensis TaxID=3157707 RepID=UPI0032B81C93